MPPGFPIDPVSAPLSPEAFRNQIRSLIQSYHASDTDFIAEIIQNSIDALEDVYGTDGRATPIIELEINSASETITIRDNGPGLPDNVISKLGTPNFTTKFLRRRRGHKGVGLSFAAWSSSSFRFATRRVGEASPTAGKLIGAFHWVTDGGDVHPMVDADASFTPEFLQTHATGTVLEFVRPPQFKVSTLVKRLKNEGLQYLLRTHTALGYLDLPRTNREDYPVWLRNLSFTIKVDGNTPVPVASGYAFPHEHFGSRAFNIQALASLSEDRRERLRGTKRCLYTVLSPADVCAFFSSDDDASLLDLCQRQGVRAYAAFLDSAAAFGEWNESLYRQGGGGGRRRAIAKPGIHFATSTMPAGEVVDIFLRYGTGNANRLFVVVQFNDIPPDIGRKTFDRDVVEVAQRIANNTSRTLLVPNRGLLVATEEAHGISEADRQMSLQDLIRKAAQKPDLDIQTLGLVKAPANEQEVVALFHAFVAAGYLKGYRVSAVFGSSEKYDGVFHYRLPKTPNVLTTNSPLGIREAEFGGRQEISLDGQIVEFKLKLSSLIRDFEGGNKAFDEINLAIAWDEGDLEAFGGSSNYRLEDVGADGQGRIYFGTTHVLRLATLTRKAHVILLKNILPFIVEAAMAPRTNIPELQSSGR